MGYNRPWTEDDDALLGESKQRGATTREISVLLNRSHSAVKRRWTEHRCGWAEPRADRRIAAQAHLAARGWMTACEIHLDHLAGRLFPVCVLPATYRVAA